MEYPRLQSPTGWLLY